MIFLDLIQNIALLVSLAVGYRLLSSGTLLGPRAHGVASGLLFGLVALVGMATPVTLTPGLIFDGRSIVMALAGFVGGAQVAVIAAVPPLAYRVWIGGVGTSVGVATILEAGALGVLFHWLRMRRGGASGTAGLWLLGLTVHGVMGLLMLSLPTEARALIWPQVGLAILVVYPAATVLVARVFLDYEAQHRQQADLASREARYQAVWRSVGEAVISVDRAGLVDMVNPAAAALTGWAVESAVGRPVAEVLDVQSEGSGSPLRGWVDAVLESRDVPDFPPDAILVARDGAHRPIACSAAVLRGPAGDVTGAVFTARDQSEERQARVELRESQERMDLALRGGDLGTWDWDVTTGRVVYNERWAEMLGYSLDEVEPSLSTWEKLVHPDDHLHVKARLERHLDGSTSSYESEHRLRHNSGRWVWVLDKGRVLARTPHGRPLRAAGTHLDITPAREAMDDLRRRERTVRRRNRALLDLMSSGDLFRGDLERAVRRITETAATLTDSDRVSVWWYDEDHSRLRCFDLLTRATGEHDDGDGLEAIPSSSYLEAHLRGEVVVLHDVHADARTRAIDGSYWNQNDVRSAVDAPIWIHHRVGGVLSVEQVGVERVWDAEDERLVSDLAALVTLCVESAERHRAEEKLSEQLREVKRVEDQLRESLENADRARKALLSTLEDRARAQEGLRRSEEFIRAVMDHLPIGVAVNKAPPPVEFTYINDNFVRLYRTTREALASPDAFWEAVYQDPETRERIKAQVLADAASGDPDRMHWSSVPITREGEPTRYVSARNTPVPGRDLVISTVWDVTERVEAVEALRESEARFRRLAENAPDVIYRYRFHPESGFDYVSPAATTLTGYTPEEHYADPDLGRKMVHPEDVDRMASVAAGGAAPVTLRWIHKDGSVIWTEQRNVPVFGEDGAVVAVEGIARDITQRVRREQALQASEERFRQALDHIPDVLVIYDPDLRIQYINESTRNVTGRSPEEFLGKREEEIHPPAVWQAYLPTLERALATGEPQSIETILELPRTGKRFLRILCLPLREPDGSVREILGITRDLTEARRAEEEIRSLAKSLEEKVRRRTRQLSELNAELESFAYSVSHDLKAPLRAIDCYSALLEEGPGRGLDEEGLRLLREVRSNAQFMGQLIEDLLAFSRVGRARLNTEDVDLGEMIQALVEQERRLAPTRTIEVEADALPVVRGDPMLLRQALANLVGNSVKFTRTRDVAKISVSAEAEKQMARISFRDNGVGFDPRYTHKLFRVFERLHYQEEFEGTGVGLAIVRRVVERHGGTVTISGEIDKGVLVELTLPLAERD